MRDIFIDNVCDFGVYNVPLVIDGRVIVYHKILVLKVIQVFQNASIVSFMSNENFAFRAAFEFGWNVDIN